MGRINLGPYGKIILTIIILLIICIGVIITCVYINEELTSDYINTEYINDDYLYFIKGIINICIGFVGIALFKIINKKWLDPKKSLMDALDDHSTGSCPMDDRPSRKLQQAIGQGEFNGQYEINGSLDVNNQQKTIINNLIQAIRNNDKNTVNDIFVNQLNWVKCGSQEDATEFLNKLLGVLSNEEKYDYDKNGEIIKIDNYNINNKINDNYYFNMSSLRSDEIKDDNNIIELIKNQINEGQNSSIFSVQDDQYKPFNDYGIRIIDKYKICIGFIVQLGNSIGDNGGHYITFAQYKNGWYVFDDTNVTPYNDSNIIINKKFIQNYGNYNYFTIKSTVFGKKLKDYNNTGGLLNLGNTCYSNSALQLLMATDLLDNNQQPKADEPSGEIAKSLRIKAKHNQIKIIINKINELKRVNNDLNDSKSNKTLYTELNNIIDQYLNNIPAISENNESILDEYLNNIRQIRTMTESLYGKKLTTGDANTLLTDINKFKSKVPTLTLNQTTNLENNIVNPILVNSNTGDEKQQLIDEINKLKRDIKKLKTDTGLDKSRSITKNIMIYNTFDTLVDKYMRLKIGILNNNDELNRIYQKGVLIIELLNKLNEIKQNKQLSSYNENMEKMLKIIDNIDKRSINESSDLVKSIKILNNNTGLTSTSTSSQNSFLSNIVDGISGIANSVGNLFKDDDTKPKATTPVPFTLNSSAPAFEMPTKPKTEVPAIIPKAASINMEEIKINNNAFNCLVTALTDDAITMINRTKIEDISYLSEVAVFLNKIEMTNNKNNLYYDNNNQLRESIYFKCILNSVDKNNNTTKIIAKYLVDNGEDILKEITKNIKEPMENKLKELDKKSLNTKVADQLKLWIIKVHNIYENLVNNKNEFLENVNIDTNPTDGDIANDTILDDLNTELNEDKDNQFIDIINDNTCISIKEIMSSIIGDDKNDKYIKDLKNLLKAELYRIVRLLADLKSKREVRKIRQIIISLATKLNKYLDINNKEQINEIESLINSIIQIIEDGLTDEYEIDEDGVDQYSMYSITKKLEKNKKYGRDNTPFDKFYKELEEETI